MGGAARPLCMAAAKAVGADRVAEMVGAKSTYGAPALVIDLGTSTTFELLDETGAFRGGIIAPGMKLGAQALARGAAQLAAVELRAPKSLLGRTTVEAMQAGIVIGEVSVRGHKAWREAMTSVSRSAIIR